MIYVSYTATKRWEKCGELQRQYKFKEIERTVNDRPFLMGRVVHAAKEAWINHGGRESMQRLFEHHWPLEEADAKVKWKYPDDRSEVYYEGLRVCGILETTLNEIEYLSLSLEPEAKVRATLEGEVGMYAQPDAFGWAPNNAPLLYVVELKSGSSYDPKQVNWYAMAKRALTPLGEDPGYRFKALVLRPATKTPVYETLIEPDAMWEQGARALATGRAWLANHYPTRPQSFCSACEARGKCPDYQSKFGGITEGGAGLDRFAY